MKKVLLFFCFYVILSALGLGQSQICYNDHERIFVLGVRYFKEPVLVIEKKYRHFVVIEKDNISECAEKDEYFYTQMWAFQPNSYGALENADFMRNFLIPQLKDSLEQKALLDQLTSDGRHHRLSINSELSGKKHIFKNLIYYDLLCKRYLVVLISEGVLEKYYHVDLDPMPVYREPKYGIYTKYLIPLPIGDTTYVGRVNNYN